MMMSRIVSYLLATLNCIVFVPANTAFGEVVENNDLAEVIPQYHDTHIVVEDLAHFLATPNYKRNTQDGCVQTPVDSTIYNSVPNSDLDG